MPKADAKDNKINRPDNNQPLLQPPEENMLSTTVRSIGKNRGLSRLMMRSFSTQIKKSTPSVTKTEVPPELQVMAGYAEHVDAMTEKADNLEKSMGDLKKTYEKKRQLKPDVKWMDSSEIDRLFIQAAEQKEDMAAEIAELKEILKSAKQIFAVDAPDGETDWHLKEEMSEVNHLIEDAAKLEDTDAVKREHQMAEELRKKIYAVDAPDGETDGHINEEMEEITHIIDDAAVLEDTDAVKREHQMAEELNKKIFAVDAPDGETDGHINEEMEEITHIIDDAAVLEDKQAIIRKHALETAVRKEHAKDPEHDW